MNLIDRVEEILVRYFSTYSTLKTVEFQLEEATKKGQYWEGRADFWHKEFDKCYNVLQRERKGKNGQ